MEDFIYVICVLTISLFFGWISASISKKRGMSGGFWWGFFLWIIGIIVVALLPADTKKQEEFLDNSLHIYYCAHCEKTYSGVSDKKNDSCPNCGSLLLETTILRDTWQSFSGGKKEQIKKAFAAGQYLRHPALSSVHITVVDGAEEIKKFKELLDEGIITQEEFDTKKKQLLGL